MDLIDIKEILDEKKAEKERLTGQYDSYMDQLKELGYSTVKTASKALLKIEQTINDMQEACENELELFESEYKVYIYED